MDENGWVEVTSGSESESLIRSQATTPTAQHTLAFPDIPVGPVSQEAYVPIMPERQASMQEDAAPAHRQARQTNEVLTSMRPAVPVQYSYALPKSALDPASSEEQMQAGHITQVPKTDPGDLRTWQPMQFSSPSGIQLLQPSAPPHLPSSSDLMAPQLNVSYANRAFEDYSFQLMLLEKQRKAAMMLASNIVGEHGDNNDGAMDAGNLPIISHESDIRLPDAVTSVDDNKSKDPVSTSPPKKGDKQTGPIFQSPPCHARQDYQMQLMLLEQQNKKRLLMARQEQDSLSAYKPGEVFSHDEPDKGSSKTLAQKDYEMQLTLLEQQNKKRLLLARQEQDDTSRWSAAEKEGRSSTFISPHLARTIETMPQHIGLLYRIECTHPCHNDSGLVFLDRPQLATYKSDPRTGFEHFRADHRHQDLDTYLEHGSDDKCALVVRTLSCSSASDSKRRRADRMIHDEFYDSSDEFDSCASNSEDTPEWTESFHFKSRFIESTIKHIAQAHFQRQEPIRPRRKPKKINTPDPFKNQIIHEAPFWFHHRAQLRHRLEQETNPDLKSQIQSLLDYIQYKYAKEFAEADDLFARGLVNRKHAVKLFQPNEALISERFGKPVAFILQEWPEKIEQRGCLPHEGRSECVRLTAWSYQSNGTAYVRALGMMYTKSIEEEPSSITALSVYPMRFATDKQRELLQSQGKKAFEVGKQSLITYTGWNAEKDRYLFKARFKIDFTHTSSPKDMLSFHTNGHFPHGHLPYGHIPPSLLDEHHKPHDFDPHPVRLDASKETENFPNLLLGPSFRAFSLDERQWFNLLVDGVRPAAQSLSAFERLVLPDETKDLIKTLVTMYTSQGQVDEAESPATTHRDDIRGGNGNALLLLFHGPPGAGKTYAAKSVAEAAGVPLYRIPCTDVQESKAQQLVEFGQTHYSPGMEGCIKDAIHRGQKWQCVLLLDDADFFLSQRCAEGKKTVPSASALLHQMQSYNGVIILTTAHLEAFDEAFLSRMQGIVHFERLDSSAETQIWQNAIDELKESGVEGEWDWIENHLENLAGQGLNGHQIHNVLTTARQLAKHHGDQLSWGHLRKAFNMTMNLIDRTVPALDSAESLAWGKRLPKGKNTHGKGW